MASEAALFAYGTLIVPAVFEAVTRVAIVPRPAQLDGYRRGTLPERVYPGIAPHAGSSVSGGLFERVPPEAWAVLDAFEGDEYERVECEVECGTRRVWASVYVLSAETSDELEASDWDLGRFESEQLSWYLEGCRRFRRSWERGER